MPTELSSSEPRQHAVAGCRLQLSWDCSEPRRSTIRAAGELDLAAADQLRTVLDQQCDSGHCFARVDLSAVTFLDCACLGVLVEAHHRFLAAHGTLLLTGVGPRVDRLIELAGLDQTLFASAAPAAIGAHPADQAVQAVQALTDKADSARTNLARQAVIDQALGVLMGQEPCGPAEAEERLRRLARSTNRSREQVARSILDEASHRAGPRPAAAQPTAARRTARTGAARP